MTQHNDTMSSQYPFPPDSHDSHENRTFPAISSFNTYSLVTERGGAEKKMKIALFYHVWYIS